MACSLRCEIGIVLACAAYIGSFYLLMVPHCPAYDRNDKAVFNNCPRFSETVRVPGPLSIFTGRANLLNYVYYPFEFIYTGPKPKRNPNHQVNPTASSPVGEAVSLTNSASAVGHLSRSTGR
jgi:hypothetical protein